MQIKIVNPNAIFKNIVQIWLSFLSFEKLSNVVINSDQGIKKVLAIAHTKIEIRAEKRVK